MTYSFAIYSISHKVSSRLVNFEAEGGTPDDNSERVSWSNGILLNKTLNALEPGNYLNDLT